MDDGTRLNKFLASCGVGSRRACDAMVQEGRVEINGKPCLNPAERVGADDFVKADGRRVRPKATGVIMLNKPRGLVCSKEDELGRDTVFELLPGSLQHLNHVGRLDRDSEGLLLMTNDGDLTQNLLHPSKNIEKEYLVTANQAVADEHLDQFLAGLYTEDGKMQAKEVERLSGRRVRVVLITGHKRQIRVMFRTLGYRVERLVRVRIGSFELADLAPGKWRHLQAADLELLQRNPEPRKRPAARRSEEVRASHPARKSQKPGDAKKTPGGPRGRGGAPTKSGPAKRGPGKGGKGGPGKSVPGKSGPGKRRQNTGFPRKGGHKRKF